MRHDEDPMEGITDWLEIFIICLGVTFILALMIGTIIYALTT